MVEATFDTGPLAGLLKTSKGISWDGKEVSP